MTIFDDVKKGLNRSEESVLEDNVVFNDAEAENLAEEDNGESVKSIVKKLEEEKAELVNLTQRLQADFENFRRRTRGEKDELIQYASQGVITKLLPVLDNFDRALSAAKEREAENGFIDGVEMIFRQLLQVLASEGLEEVDAIGCAFDPNCHDAVMQVEDSEAEKNTVLEEVQKGYRLKGKLIRPSMVKVAQ